MEWLTYLVAAAAIVVSITVAFIGSLVWVGWWRQRHWPRDDL